MFAVQGLGLGVLGLGFTCWLCRGNLCEVGWLFAQFRHASPRPSRLLPLVQAAMGVHAPFVRFPCELAMTHARAGIAWGPSRGVIADSKHPHTLRGLARGIAVARSRSAKGSDLMAREYYTMKYATGRSLQHCLGFRF